jgi:hypothetical protein
MEAVSSDEMPIEQSGEEPAAEEPSSSTKETAPEVEHLQAFIDSCDDGEQRELFDLLKKKFDPAESDKKYNISDIADFSK